ncbi:tyrosine-type recombinase/integrase [Planctomicrobium sp. SH661]|uniref:tyrosine-type recombinase/integrase n=1 Tax=Planctomicrobium sp. SH661 TaxID=3448124 RepID=UPI003F5B8ED4
MPRSVVPSYGFHKPSGQARVRIDGKDHWLGQHGSPESYEKYSKLILEWQQSPKTQVASGLSVRHLVLLYLQRCKQHYRKGGEMTSEVNAVKIAMRHVVKLYKSSPAREFSPKALRAVRQSMIDSGYVRSSINQHIGRIRRMFKWAVAEELVAVEVYLALGTLDGLLAGRTDAVESEPVVPVPEARVLAIEKTVSRPVWGMIQLQMVTGMRPGEVRRMRGCDLNVSGEIWEYRPQTHKTQHHGKGRVVAIGPAGQKILREFLKGDLQEYLFSPRSVQRGRAGACYTSFSYHRAITRGCEVAFGMPDHLRRIDRYLKNQKELNEKQKISLKKKLQKEAVAWRAEHCWSPNQLRHNFATRARREFGIEAARVTLGHSSAVTSEIYAEKDLDAARAVVAKIG